MKSRPEYLIRVRPNQCDEYDPNGFVRLRHVLKRLGRTYSMTVVSVLPANDEARRASGAIHATTEDRAEPGGTSSHLARKAGDCEGIQGIGGEVRGQDGVSGRIPAAPAESGLSRQNAKMAPQTHATGRDGSGSGFGSKRARAGQGGNEGRD